MSCRLKTRRHKFRCLLVTCFVVATVTVLSGTLTGYTGRKVNGEAFASIQDFVVKPDLTSDKKYDVILSAYMNSGSRYTSQLLGFRPDTFFFYEPLWKFSLWDYFKPPNQACSSTLGSCRTVKLGEVNSFKPVQQQPDTLPIVDNFTSVYTAAVPTDVLIHVISSIYSCKLAPLKNVVQERVHDDTKYDGPSWDVYRQCISKFKAKSECLRQLEHVCRSRKHRVTKILRSTIGAFRPLLLSNPRLKIIHLVRDPRAIIHSRIYSRHYPVYGFRENDSLEINLCEKMLTDFHEGVRLMREFPDRVKFLYYEDLLKNVHVRLKQVLDFLNMDYNQTQVDSLAKIQVNQSPVEKGNGHVKDRRENNSDWWRKYIQQHDVDRANKACLLTLRAYGYKTFTNYLQLRNFNLRGYEIPDHLVF